MISRSEWQPRSEAYKEVLAAMLTEADSVPGLYDGDEELSSMLDYDGKGDYDHAASKTVMSEVEGSPFMYNNTYRSNREREVGVETFDYAGPVPDPSDKYRLTFDWSPEDDVDEPSFFGRIHQDGTVVYDTTDKPGGMTQDGIGFPGHEVIFSELDPDFVRERDVFAIEDVATALFRTVEYLSAARKVS